jgi:sugar/nucleoside kinase (ribokinase family)
MVDTTYDVAAIGNAIVDVITDADDAFLSDQGIAKGGMTLIDEDRAIALYDQMAPAKEISGGSAANTIAGVASLGDRSAYVGKVRDDQLGAVFTHDIRAAGVSYETEKATAGPATARCLILVTPDAQRSMNTYLGASQNLLPDDIPENVIAGAAITYLEGYLWDPEHAKAAFRKAIKIARAANRKIAFTLSDQFCVDRFRDEFLGLLKDKQIDILFANEAELLSLFQTGDFDDAANQMRALAPMAAITRSEKGCVILQAEKTVEVSAAPVAKIMDTTGAGDLFAAGFLSGVSNGRTLTECGQLGAIAASEVISHYGARPEADLKELTANI